MELGGLKVAGSNLPHGPPCPIRFGATAVLGENFRDVQPFRSIVTTNYIRQPLNEIERAGILVQMVAQNSGRLVNITKA